MIRLYSPRDIERIARAGDALARVLADVSGAVAPGLGAADIDALARERIRAENAEPLLPLEKTVGGTPFPGVLSVCINDEAANAPPGERSFAEGDIVTLDGALRLEGFCADGATSVVVGAASPPALMTAARAVTRLLVDRIAPGVRWGSLIHFIEAEAARHDCRVAPTPAGHGTGRSLHEAPRLTIPARDDVVFRPGMVLAVEPIILEGRHGEGVRTEPDGTTIKTRDGSRAAFEERTVAVTPDGCRVLTPIPPFDPALCAG